LLRHFDAGFEDQTMAAVSLTTLSPVPPYLDQVAANEIAARPATLDGKRLGLLANWRASSVPVLTALSTLLAERYHLKAVVIEQPLLEPPLKDDNVLASMQGKLDQLAPRVDVVITGSADCGGGAAWCSQVMAVLEKRGVPTVMIATDTFTKFARRMASLQGYPGLIIAETSNPMHHDDSEWLQARAMAMLPVVIAGLVQR
jgi:hypothetical protein